MEIRQRVHIVPLGYEYERIMEPVRQFKADKVVILRYASGRDPGFGVIEDLQADDRVDLEVRDCDIFDLYDSLETMVAAIADHEDDDVFVNLATGSKITAIAGMIACQSTGATPFYVAPGPEGEPEPRDEPRVSEAGEIRDLPVFPISGPQDQQLSVLDYLEEREQATKKDLIEFGKQEELPFVTESSSKSEEGLYRRLESHIIGPLEEEGYVTVTKSGRQKQVAITEDGRNVNRAFPAS